MDKYLLLTVVMLPILIGLIAFIVRHTATRNVLIVLASLTIAGASVALAYDVLTQTVGGKMVFTEAQLFGNLHLGKIIMFLDFALLGYIIYIGAFYKRWLILLFGVLQVVPLMFFETYFNISEPDVAFVVDRLGVIMLLVVSVIGSAIAIFSIGYMKAHEEHLKLNVTRQTRFFGIVFLFLGAMNALVLTNNLLWMYFFWEITTLCSYWLISHDKTEESINNGLKALMLNSLGGVAFIAGIITVFMVGKTIAIDEIISSGLTLQAAILLPMGLLCFAGFTKAAQFPFQSWLLGAMVAPTPISALLHSSTMVKAGVYIVVRFAPVFAATMLGKSVAVIGAFTFLAGSAIAISQSNAKRVLAYSTIANLGLIVCCAGLGSTVGLAIAMILIVVHAVSKALLFLCVGAIDQGIGSRDIEDMQGLMKRMPFTASVLVLGMISMLLPPFGVFMTKWLTIEAAMEAPLVLLFLVLGSACTVVFWAKWIGIVLTMSFRKKFEDEKLPFSMKSILSVLVLIMFAGSIMIVHIYNFLVEPFVKYTAIKSQLFSTGFDTAKVLTGNRFGVSLESANSVIGNFPLFVFFGLFLIILALIPYFFSKIKESHVRKPYMCGENALDDPKGISAVMAGDKVDDVVVRNYYFKGYFSEKKLTLWVNLIAMVIILVMFGVVINV